MARITVEDCLTKQTNRFGLVLLASKRTKQLLNGGKQVIADNRGNKAVVTSLREIADGRVRFMSEEDLRIQREQDEKDRAERAAARSAAAPAVAAPAVSDVPVEAVVAADDSSDDGDNRNGNGSNDAAGL